MNSKKGFTLIELLAVIVILAIIALIATPIVLNIINNSKKSSDERSIELYGEAVEQAVAKTQLNSSEQPLGKYTSTDGKTLTNGTSTIKVDYKGNKVVCNVTISQKGTIYLDNCKVNDKKVEYTYGEKEIYKIYKDGEVVYFDVDTGKKCTNYKEAQSNTGVKSGCMKFYAFNDDGEENLNLILDHNTTATIAWNLSGSNSAGPSDTFLNQLKADTENWKGTITPENYTIDQSTQTSGAKYTIDYSDYKARIITAQEIAQITGNTSWDETLSSSSWFYLDTNTTTQSDTCKSGNTTGCKYGWLYDRTKNCQTYGCEHSDSSNSGYWSATPSAGHSSLAWSVEYGGNLRNDAGSVGGLTRAYGVRPVITVLKSNL